MAKAVKILLIIILLVILTTVFFRNEICRILIYKATARATDLEISIKTLDLDLLRGNLYMHEIILFNPPGFETDVLAKADEISLGYRLFSLLRGKFHFREVKADIAEINIIRNEEGKSNVASFKKMRAKAKAKKAKSTPAQQTRQIEVKKSKKKKQPKFLIERLELSLGRATFVNYAAGTEKPSKIEFALQGPSVFTNVSDLNYVFDSVSVEGGFKSALSLFGVNPNFIKNTAETMAEKIIKALPNSDSEDGTQ